jgi:hypothetical protein
LNEIAPPRQLKRYIASSLENRKMGAWGAGSFENDDAADWLADFCGAPNKQSIVDALAGVADMGAAEYLEGPDCSVGIAAAELVAALKGAPNRDLTAEARDCVTKLESEDANLPSLALKTVERIKTNSELKELWDESETQSEWYASLSDLEARLQK